VLARLFAVEVAFHADHMHVIVRTRPDVAGSWSDEDVVKRWLSKRNGAARKIAILPKSKFLEGLRLQSLQCGDSRQEFIDLCLHGVDLHLYVARHAI